MSDEEVRWVRLAIKKQEQSIKFREAIIEKGMWVLALGVIGFIGTVFLEYIRNHGWKP